MQSTTAANRARKRSSLRNGRRLLQNEALVGKKPHLPRPQKLVSYNLPKHLRQADEQIQTRDLKQFQPSKTISEQDALSNSLLLQNPATLLGQVIVLLDLLHRRNKNQHRNQPFFKWLNLLRRAMSQLLELHLAHRKTNLRTEIVKPRSDSIQAASAYPKSSQLDNSASNTADHVRRRLEHEAELRSQRELHENWVTETLIPKAYVAFSSLICDTQFANLGIVLTGVLSDIAGIVGVPKRIEGFQGTKSGDHTSKKAVGKSLERSTLIGESTIVTGPDVGEVVERTYDNGVGTYSITTKDRDISHAATILEEIQTHRERLEPEKQHRSKRLREQQSIYNLRADEKQHKLTLREEMAPPLQDDVIPKAAVPNNITAGLATTNNTPSSSSQNQAARKKTSAQVEKKSQVLDQNPPQPQSQSSLRTTSSPPTLSSSSAHLKQTPTQNLGEPRKKATREKRKRNVIDDLFNGF